MMPPLASPATNAGRRSPRVSSTRLRVARLLLAASLAALSMTVAAQTAPASSPSAGAPLRLGTYNIFPYSEDYPPEAVNRRLQGAVAIRATMGENGRFLSPAVETSSNEPLLDAAALKAATQMGLRPGESNIAAGRTVLIPVEFVLDTVGTLPNKTCAELNADIAQSQRRAPDRDPVKLPVFDMATGIFFSQGEFSETAMRNLKTSAARTIAQCRAAPERKFLDVYFATLRQ